MSTSIIEPGTRLSGRYRLEERVSQSGGSTLWKATDEILARAVAVRTFDPGFPRVSEVVTAARAASRLTDPRLTQVFDADDSGEQAYVVSEWAAGESLEGMLKRAPLEPGRAATLLYEAAEAIAAAHAAGLSHLRLCPRDLLWTTGGTVKLLGVAVDAVLADVRSENPALEDTRALGRMLYAAVTAHWPGDPADCDLPPAPKGEDGAYRAARQVQAGVSMLLDGIICRAVGLPAPDGRPPLTTPAELAAALKSVPRTPLPLFAGPTVGPPPAVVPRPSRPAPATAGRPPAEPRPPAASQPSPQPRQQGFPPAAAAGPTRPTTAPAPQGGQQLSRPLLAVAAAAVTVIVGIGAWALFGGGNKDGAPQAQQKTPTASASARPAAKKLPIEKVTSRYENRPGQGDHPDSSIVRTVRAINDGKERTVWHSQSYADPEFGNYLTGLGVVLDMGSSVSIDRIELTVPPAGAGAALEVSVGDSNVRESMQKIGDRSTSAGTFQITPGKTVRGRYVLLWFTRLPPSNKVQVGEVAVYGRAN